MNSSQSQRQREQEIKRTLLKSSFLVFAMFAFAFALVPLYEVFCEVTGLNGKSINLVKETNQNNIDEIIVDKSRKVRVQFVANNNKHVPWDFAPVINEVYLHPGEVRSFKYKAKNLTGKDMIVRAVPSVSPNSAASYLRKIECFCFEKQSLKAGEDTSLPVQLYVHKSLPKDITTLTLSYSLFDITPKDKLEENKIKELSKNKHDNNEHSNAGEDI